MNALSWNTLLFAFKWVFIGLIYFALLILLLAVRREMAQRMGTAKPAALIAPGQLRILQAGSDARLQPGAVVNLRPETRLGAEPDNDVVLEDRFVSAYHARLRWDGVAWWVEDLGSRNGTFVNQRRCPPHTPQPVPVGATVQVGDMSFELLD